MKRLPVLRHEMLIANAGSGKTYHLTIRTITLLARGVRPEKIAALTFTRKAAGEFLEAVFLRLAKAALEPSVLAILQRDTGLETLDAARCRGILADLVAQMHRLNMGTIDSLFGKIAHAFPLETGLAGDFSILDESGQSVAQQEVLATLFRENARDEARFRSFLEIVRQQSRRQSEREVFSTLLSEVGQLHGKLLRHRTEDPWGHRTTIWPDGSEILNAGKHGLAAEALATAIFSSHLDLDPGAKAKWEGYLSNVCSHVEEQAWGEPLKKFIKEKLCSCKTDSTRNLDYLPTGNAAKARIYLHPEVLSARRTLLLCLLRPRIEQLLDRSRSLHAMMDGFEKLYARFVRDQGQITFEDITLTLANHVTTPEFIASVGYRLDGKFDHWLLDEFQDTSRPQWKVLGAFIDEVVQDESGGRSFFYVGDIKQAIYSWRGGDPKLFFEIRDYYNQGKDGPIIAAAPLSVSFRSDPEIIQTVNTIFGNLTSLQEQLGLPEKTVADWTRAWVPHQVAHRNQSNRGYFCWTAVTAGGESEEELALDPADAEILSLLLEIRPWQRGWTCAALKRDNKKLVALAAVLQANGIPLTIEGKSNPCTDNPLGAALLAAFRLAASPGDVLSRMLVAASPLGSHLLAKGESRFRERTLRQIARDGFCGTIRAWLTYLDLTLEPFLTSRAREVLDAADQFDAGRRSSDGIGSFVSFLEGFQRQEPEGAETVRLMTIHQAKGLTLDMVIVSGLDSHPLAKDRTSGTMALQTNRHEKLWGMLMPEADLSRHDPILSQTTEAIVAESTYGELCAAYVALTRPKHGLYVITKKLKEGSSARNFARMLDLTLGQGDPTYQCGDPLWFQARPFKAPFLLEEISYSQTLPTPIDGTPHARYPSHHSGTAGSGSTTDNGVFFADAAALGTEIHAYLAEIEWLDGAPPPTGSQSDAAQEILSAASIWNVFAKPPGPILLWREQAFDLLLDGNWVTGVFDRVEIALDGEGSPVAAKIYDFKTDSTVLLENAYEEQLSIYCAAAALLLGLPIAAIRSHLVTLR